MAFKLFDDHEPNCAYCLHSRRQNGETLCVKRGKAGRACGSFAYDPLKRVPRQEARLPEYDPSAFAISELGGEDEFDFINESDNASGKREF